MQRFSTRGAAKKLGLSHEALARYVRSGKVPAPETVSVGERIVQMWTKEEIEHVRKLLPKIANGRKTRYQKLREKGAPPTAAVPHEHRRSSAGVPVPQKKKRKPKKK